MIKLILKLKDTQIEEFALEKEVLHIGRAQENDIVIDNIAVSRRHAQVERREESFLLRDLNSSNGTYLNGVRIDAQDHELHDGDLIGIAKFEIQVKGVKLKEAPPRVLPQQDGEGTMIFDARRKAGAEAAPDAPAAKAFHWPVLSAVKGSSEGKTFKISKEATLLGKGRKEDIPAEGWFVSSPHARISRHGERFYISHVGGFFSKTRVNGVSVGQDHILKNKDEIEIGNCKFIFTQS